MHYCINTNVHLYLHTWSTTLNLKLLIHFTVMIDCEYFLTFTQYNQRSTPSNWWLYQLKSCVRSRVIHLTLKRTWGPLFRPTTGINSTSLFFSPRFPCLIKDLPLASPLTLPSLFHSLVCSFTHSLFSSRSFSSPLQLSPHLLVFSGDSHQIRCYKTIYKWLSITISSPSPHSLSFLAAAPLSPTAGLSSFISIHGW